VAAELPVPSFMLLCMGAKLGKVLIWRQRELLMRQFQLVKSNIRCVGRSRERLSFVFDARDTTDYTGEQRNYMSRRFIINGACI
jgi:hypothetical protein